MSGLSTLEGGSEGAGLSSQSKMKSYIGSLFTLKYIMYALLAIILIVLGYYIYQNVINKKNVSFKDNNQFNQEGDNTTGNEAELMMFTVDWCPHCKTALPEWNKLKAEYEGKDINNYTLIFTQVNCTEETPEVTKLMNTYKIEGYPTIKMLKGNEVIEYDAKPQYDTLKEFINSVL